GTGMTTKGLRIEKLSLTALNPPLTTTISAFSTSALLSSSLPWNRIRPPPCQTAGAGRPTTSISNGQSVRSNITGEPNREPDSITSTQLTGKRAAAGEKP